MAGSLPSPGLIAREAACLFGAEGGHIVRFGDGEGQVVGSWDADEERGRVVRMTREEIDAAIVARTMVEIATVTL